MIMIEMLDNDITLCEAQAQLFEYAASQGYDVESFALAFLSSDFCRRAFDTIYSRFHCADAEECEDFYLPEIEEKLTKSSKRENNVAYEIGFLYRLLYIFTSIPSAELVCIIPFDTMLRKAIVAEHYGYDEMALDLMKEFGLPENRFDKDFVPLSQEQIAELELHSKQEHEDLCKKHLKNEN